VQCSRMTTKDLTLRWFDEIWNRKNPEVIRELMDTEGVGCTEGGEVVGPEAFVEQMFVPLHEAFPDLRLTLHGVIVEGEESVVRWTAAATQAGPLLGIAATGKKVTFSGMTWLRFRDGKVVEGWDRWNLHGLLALLTTGGEAATVKCVG
jgi:predicted ester cyclase